MTLCEKFWATCKNFIKGYNVWKPAPGVQKILETKGYHFEPPLSTPFGRADYGTITNREGVNVSQFFANRRAVRQYKYKNRGNMSLKPKS